MVHELVAAISRAQQEPLSAFESIGAPAMQYVCVHGSGENWESCDDHNLKVHMLLFAPGSCHASPGCLAIPE